MKVYPLENEKDKEYLLSLNKINKPFPPHRHTFLELSYIISGQGKEIINGKEHKLEKGVFTLLLPYQVHELIPDPDNTLKIYNCNLSMESFFGHNKLSEELNEMIFESGQNLASYAKFSDAQGEVIEKIFSDMLMEIEKNNHHSDLMFKTKVIEVFILFDRLRRENTSRIEKKHPLTKENKDSYLWELIFFIHNHYMEELSLSRLAKEVGVSDSHLSTTFKDFFGENVHSFINDIRIKHSCALLISSDKQIIDIANEVGFNSYATFSRVFRQKMGQSASEYKNKVLKV
ncbi:AraC family transcriptional regulator [Natronospora cellulosivora (SeqCode)]